MEIWYIDFYEEQGILAIVDIAQGKYQKNLITKKEAKLKGSS